MLRFNENNEVIEQEAYKAILVGLQLNEDISYSMEELKGLAEAANVEVLGGCNCNLKGICSLVEGMAVTDVIAKTEGICCGMKSTSCPDQLATALKKALEQA